MLIDGQTFEIKPVSSKENVENPEVARFIRRTHNRTITDHSTIKNFDQIIKKNFPDVLKNNLADYYIPSLDLYVDARLNRTNNYNLFRPGNGIQQTLLNQLIQQNDADMIKQWCIVDLQKSKSFDKPYLEVYKFQNENDVITQIRRVTEGLKIQYSHNEMRNELKNIITKPGRFDSGCHLNRITNTFNPHFYEQEQKLYKNSITRRWIIENLEKYLVRNWEAGGPAKAIAYNEQNEPIGNFEAALSDAEILRQFRISRICDGFSQHSPLWIKAFIEKYNPKSIYDPTGGWGHRLLGAWSVDYIYNDIDERSVLGAQNIYKEFKDDPVYGCNTTAKLFFNKDAAYFTPEPNYDTVFTCPPYFLVEEYNHKNTSTNLYPNYNDWLNIWWKNVVSNATKPSVKYFAFVINNTYKEDMINVCLQCNLRFVEEIPINRETSLNHFHRIPIEKRIKMTDAEKAKVRIKNISKGEQIVVLKKE